MSLKKFLLLLCVHCVFSEDSKTVVFPSTGNESSVDQGNKSTLTFPPNPPHPPSHLSQPFVPSTDRFYTGRSSEPTAYIHEYPNFVHPLTHSIEHHLTAPPKHLVVASFIGLLLLFAIIQNTLIAFKRRESSINFIPSRRKRTASPVHTFETVTPEQARILNDDAGIRCIQRTVCQESRRLTGSLGIVGKMLAEYLTTGLERSLESSPGWDRLVQDASTAGIHGENCDVVYRDCGVSVAMQNVQEYTKEN